MPFCSRGLPATPAAPEHYAFPLSVCTRVCVCVFTFLFFPRYSVVITVLNTQYQHIQIDGKRKSRAHAQFRDINCRIKKLMHHK